MTLPKDTEYFTVAEVASHLRISRMSVYRYVKSGELASVRLGASVRIPASEITRLETEGFVPVQGFESSDGVSYDDDAA